MAVSLVSGSASMTVTARPTVALPAVSGVNIRFTSTNVVAGGQCQISGSPGDSPAGWILGLIQLQWIETSWGEYRGQHDSDGSCFLQRARPPARPAQGCRDTLAVGGTFVDNNPGGDRTVGTSAMALPLLMQANFSDAPSDVYPLMRRNGRTGRNNFLHEAQLEFHFCTTLSLQDPAGNFHHLKHFMWNVHWQATFRPTNFANLALPWRIARSGGPLGNTANASAVFDGGPTERKFSSIITAAAVPNCNAVANHELAVPNTRERLAWDNFDVRR